METNDSTKNTPAPVSGLQQAMNDAAAKSCDQQKATANKQKGIAKAVAKQRPAVTFAQREMRALAQHGPVSVDDAVQALIRLGLTHSDATNKAKRMWLGGVFRGGEWMCIGTMNSSRITSNARTIKVWALKSWLDKNSLNGTEWAISSYKVVKIYNDFKRAHPTVPEERCNWIIGTEELSDETRSNVVAGGNMLYGIPVTFVGGVGAVLQIPLVTAQKRAGM